MPCRHTHPSSPIGKYFCNVHQTCFLEMTSQGRGALKNRVVPDTPSNTRRAHSMPPPIPISSRLASLACHLNKVLAWQVHMWDTTFSYTMHTRHPPTRHPRRETHAHTRIASTVARPRCQQRVSDDPHVFHMPHAKASIKFKQHACHETSICYDRISHLSE